MAKQLKLKRKQQKRIQPESRRSCKCDHKATRRWHNPERKGRRWKLERADARAWRHHDRYMTIIENTAKLLRQSCSRAKKTTNLTFRSCANVTPRRSSNLKWINCLTSFFRPKHFLFHIHQQTIWSSRTWNSQFYTHRFSGQQTQCKNDICKPWH